MIQMHGCPICGFDYDGWTLLAQYAHTTLHPWWQRWRLSRRARLPIRELLIYRKYGTTT